MSDQPPSDSTVATAATCERDHEQMAWSLAEARGDCPFGTMEWYCVLRAGHDGPHRSEVLT